MCSITSPGCYTLTHMPTGIYYIGSTKNLKQRHDTHKTLLNRGKHASKRLQEVFTCWRDIRFEYTVSDTVADARAKEQSLLDRHHSRSLCANVAAGAITPWSHGVPDDIRQRFSESSRGNLHAKGHVVSPEAREAVRLANTGLKRSPETIAKMREAKSSEPSKAASEQRRRQVTIDGKTYASLSIAGAAFGIDASGVRYRINSKKSEYAGWVYT